MRQEKPLLFYLSPYRKPTQVDEERILRPTGRSTVKELGKMTCNFGRRSAKGRASRRELAQANCLAKHRSMQNRKVKYKGLTLCPVLEG